MRSSQYQSSKKSPDQPDFETDQESPERPKPRITSLFVQDKLTAIHNILVVLMGVCRDEEQCYVLSQNRNAGQLCEEKLQLEDIREELQDLTRY